MKLSQKRVKDIFISNQADMPKDWYRKAIYDLIQERVRLVDIAKATIDMREEALKNKVWYSFIPCEYAEEVDDCLHDWEKE